MGEPFSDIRCSLCHGARLLHADGSPGACSFLGCPAPCHDLDGAKLKKLASALVAADVAIRECAVLKAQYVATMDPEVQSRWDAAGRKFERAIENAIQIAKGVDAACDRLAKIEKEVERG